jgi:hypothetical protein
MGTECLMQLGGDLLIATTSGIIPDLGRHHQDHRRIELAAITRNIKAMWRDEVNAKRQWS